MLSKSENFDFSSLVNNQQILTVPSFTLSSGKTLHQVPVAYKHWGQINAQQSNVILLCHGLTGSADAIDWWEPLIGIGKPFDTSVFFILCINSIASPYGTLSPLTLNPQTQKAYKSDFPTVTIRDSILLHQHVLDYLNIKHIQVVCGGSMGGMTALEWAIMKPEIIQNVVLIGCSAKFSSWGIAWNETQRQSIFLDPDFQNGHYQKQPVKGMALARMQALLMYRSAESFEIRFGRKKQMVSSAFLKDSEEEIFTTQNYLRYQGEKFIKRFDANCYITLTRMMDSFDVFYGRHENVLKQMQQKTLIVGIQSDLLFPIEEQKEPHKQIPNSELAILESSDGHDGFLLAFDEMKKILFKWLWKVLPKDLKEKSFRSHYENQETLPHINIKNSVFGEMEAE